ncbi:MAG: hypothetical protein J1E78_00820 [Muribaculaceae bacterium]|nr:hypothetical protein [Muribaculaceae bacterium]
MRQKISYNSDDYSGAVWTWVILICIIFCFFFWWTPSGNYDTTNATDTYSAYWGWGNGWTWIWIILGILFFWWICALCYTPLDVYADDDEVRIRRPFKTKRIRMNEIESAEPYEVSKNPSKKAFKTAPVRTFGHWGHYRDDKIGDYFAYYGKPDNTVLIRLKNGKKYVVGGTNARELSEYINSKANK